MLTIKTKIKESKINGFGIFADEFVKAGTLVWKYQDNFDVTISDEEFLSIPKIAQDYLIHYGYYNKNEGGYILCGDNAKFTNHSDTPNTKMLDDSSDAIAIKDIQIGDEITEDYYHFDNLANKKLKGKY